MDWVSGTLIGHVHVGTQRHWNYWPSKHPVGVKDNWMDGGQGDDGLGLGLADRQTHVRNAAALPYITLITAALEYKSFPLALIVRVSHSQKVERLVTTSRTLFVQY